MSNASAIDGHNRLGTEKSPYLLQHKDNPVWWWAWGDEAFAAAKREGKPVLLSIGYSTCHWCHVMEHESFENKEVADYLNKHFVAIKVDREERPDVDAVYMKAVQAMTGHGGWPMTVILTPEREPFFGGTYFPKGRFLQLLSYVHRLWTDEPEKVRGNTERIVKYLREHAPKATSSTVLGEATLKKFTSQCENSFDEHFGGFGSAPKFPPSMRLRMLLRVAARGEKGEATKALPIVEETLQRMALGGIFDQVGGGFHRYSTDEEWLVPHFEKMLYDNAILATTYLEASQLTGNPFYQSVAKSILDFTLREMHAPEGGFYSAQDADSDGREGTFYLWKEKELSTILSPQEFTAVKEKFSITPQGNFEHGETIFTLRTVKDWEWKEGVEGKAILKKLYTHREKRVHPFRDDKVLTGWNGLMIEAMARGYLVTGKAEYLRGAENAAKFLHEKMWKAGKGLSRRYRAGDVRFSGVLDDYAYLISGLLMLYQANFDPQWLTWAEALQQEQDSFLWDKKHGGYLYSRELLLADTKEFYDSARPNAQGVSALNLLKLSDFTLKAPYRTRGEEVLGAASAQVASSPYAFPSVLLALDYDLDRSKEVALVLPKSGEVNEGTHPMLQFLRQKFIPNMVVALGKEGDKDIQLLEGRKSLNGKVTAYVCEQHLCKVPTTDLDVMQKQMGVD